MMSYLSLNTAAVRLITFFISVLMCVHLTGCIWIFVSGMSENPTETWIYRYGLEDESDYSKYIAAIYWAF